MNTEVLINGIIQTFFLPPGINFALIIIGLILIRRFYATGKSLIIIGFILLFILSLPVASIGLMRILEQDKPLTLKELKKSKAKAIIVLGAGRYSNAIEYQNQTDAISSNALTRLKYAVYLHKKSNIPLLLSGGSTHGELVSEASIMQTTLENYFNLKAKWLDSNSVNTWYNAEYSAKILATENIKDVILVTHALHMPRAKMAFESFGLNVTAAPLEFSAINKRFEDYTVLHMLPSSEAIRKSGAAMHEFIGYLWYLIRYKGISP